jgi:transposase
LGRSRGGLTSKWHLAVDSFGRPLRFILTGGQANDAATALPLLAGLQAAHVIADKAYDAHTILDHIEAMGARPIIPQRSCMSRTRDFDPQIYKRRNMIERTIGRLNSSDASQPGTTDCPRTTSPASTWPHSASGPECRINLVVR